MIGYTCVCVCVCVRARARLVGWSLLRSILWHVKHISLLLLVGSKVNELSVISALYAVRTALHTFLSPQLSRVNIFRSLYE
jgi:hypothetical protein